MKKPPITLTIAGSDTSGGAGMQADLKTFTEFGTYGVVALTSIVTMDPDNNWAHGVTPIPLEVVSEQLKTIFAIEKVDAIKTGMLPTLELIKLVRQTLDKNPVNKIVIDPVMVCKGENEVLNPGNSDAMRELLLPIATVVTPNLFEASVLAQVKPIQDLESMQEAAKKIINLGAKSVVIKGGKALEGEEAIDLFYDGDEFIVLNAPKVAHAHNHGAGCTFAAAITAGLANGMSTKSAVKNAKHFVTQAINEGFALNKFIGSVYHSAAKAK